MILCSVNNLLETQFGRALDSSPEFFYQKKLTCLLHQDNQILAGAPEELRVGDAKYILFVGITL